MRKQCSRATLYFSCLIIISFCCSWGFYAHETATQLAVYKLPKHLRRFFFLNIDSLTLNSIRPDKRRSTDKTEAPKHFIDIENYGDSALYNMPYNRQEAVAEYSADTLRKYGYVPYQVLYTDSLLVNAFKQKNADSILFYAIDIAHYIEDAHVPLHTTNNYDGQLTGQKGMHALWESIIPELNLSAYNLHLKHTATYTKHKAAAIWNAIRTAHNLLPEMFEKEKEVSENFHDSLKYVEKIYYGRKTKVYSQAFAKQYAVALGASINNQLNNSINMVADFWYTAWVDAGKPNLKSLYKLSRENKKQLCKELRFYRRNKLMQNNLLRAKNE